MSDSEKRLNRSALLSPGGALDMPKIPGLSMNPDLPSRRKKLEDRLYIPPRKNLSAMGIYSLSPTPTIGKAQVK